MLIQETVERYVINETMHVVGKRLRAARKSKGLSIEAAAVLGGVSKPFLCDVENGKRGITAHRLLGVCKALGLTMGQLFKGL